MTETDLDEPAFPHMVQDGTGQTLAVQEGMSLRDWFAGMALSRMANNSDRNERIAMQCYAVADAMLDARAKYD